MIMMMVMVMVRLTWWMCDMYSIVSSVLVLLLVSCCVIASQREVASCFDCHCDTHSHCVVAAVAVAVVD